MSKKIQSLNNSTTPKFSQTVKIGLKTICRLECIKDWIFESVDVITRIGIEASRLVNLHVLRCLNQNIELPLMNQTFFYRTCVLVCSNSSPESIDDAHLIDTYKNLYKPCMSSIPAIERSADHQRMMEALAQQMTTNSKVYLRTQFLKRHQQWCRNIVHELVPIDPNERLTDEKKERKKQRYALQKWLFEQTIIKNDLNVNLEEIYQRSKDNLLETNSAVCNESICMQLAKAVLECCQKMGPRPVTYAKLRDPSVNNKYLKWMFYLLQQIEQHNCQVKESKKGKEQRTFSMQPIRGLDRCYVSVSSTALFEFLYRNRSKEEVELAGISEEFVDSENRQQAFEKFKADPLWFWNACFDLRTAVRGVRSQFDLVIHSDGIAASIGTQKEGFRKEPEEPSGVLKMDDDSEKDAKIPILEKENYRVIAVDPGAKDVFTAVENIGLDKHSVKHYSTKKWREESGANKAAQKRARWTAKEEDQYSKWLLEMPSTKTSSLEKMLEHIRYLSVQFMKCMQLNGARRVRRLRWSNYMKKQKALDKMCDDLLAGREATKDTIVVFGSAKFAANGPIQKLRRKLQERENVVLVELDEFNTSKLCSQCAGEKKEKSEVEGPLGPKQEDDAEHRSRIHGVRVCNNCRMTWNRDVNAALNMLYLFKHAQLNHGKRCSLFCRLKKSGDKRQFETTIPERGEVIRQKIQGAPLSVNTQDCTRECQ